VASGLEAAPPLGVGSGFTSAGSAEACFTGLSETAFAGTWVGLDAGVAACLSSSAFAFGAGDAGALGSARVAGVGLAAGVFSAFAEAASAALGLAAVGALWEGAALGWAAAESPRVAPCREAAGVGREAGAAFSAVFAEAGVSAFGFSASAGTEAGLALDLFLTGAEAPVVPPFFIVPSRLGAKQSTLPYFLPVPPRAP
jgi:hypothetical protein